MVLCDCFVETLVASVRLSTVRPQRLTPVLSMLQVIMQEKVGLNICMTGLLK